jgi:hypothetical protein
VIQQWDKDIVLFVDQLITDCKGEKIMAIKTGGNLQIVKVPITGKGSAIADETLIMAGVTQGTDLGLAIPVPAGNAGANRIGVLRGAHATALDSVQAGTTWTFAEVELVDNRKLIELEYSVATADTLSVTSCTGTTVTIGSLENNADCSWLYAVSGTGAGILAFCTAMNGGTATTKTATGWDSTTKVIKILRFAHELVEVNATSQLKTVAAAGNLVCFVLDASIEAPRAGITKQLLDPTKHDNLNFGGVIHPKFSTRVSMREVA